MIACPCAGLHNAPNFVQAVHLINESLSFLKIVNEDVKFIARLSTIQGQARLTLILTGVITWAAPALTTDLRIQGFLE